jgi:hypothetical protein
MLEIDPGFLGGVACNLSVWTIALDVLFFKGSIILDLTVRAVELLSTRTIPSVIKQLFQISFKRYNHGCKSIPLQMFVGHYFRYRLVIYVSMLCVCDGGGSNLAADDDKCSTEP